MILFFIFLIPGLFAGGGQGGQEPKEEGSGVVKEQIIGKAVEGHADEGETNAQA